MYILYILFPFMCITYSLFALEINRVQNNYKEKCLSLKKRLKLIDLYSYIYIRVLILFKIGLFIFYPSVFFVYLQHSYTFMYVYEYILYRSKCSINNII